MAAKKGAGKRKVKKKEPKSHRLRLHDVLLSPDCILKKVFRKDGPPLGIEFDSLPSHAFEFCKKGRKGSKCSHRHCQDKQRALKVTNASRSSAHAFDETQRALKKRKVSKPTLLDYPVCSMESVPVKKHGIGKGLMTVWRAINPDGGDFPTGVNYNERESTAVFRMATSAPRKPLVQDKKPRKRQPVMRKLGTGTKVPDKKKTPINRRKVESHNTRQMKPRKEKCELALDRVVCQEDLEQFAKLIDDEELELQELRAGPNPVTCSAHFATNGLHGCSLCKDLLAKFPPDSVVMKLSLYLQPWGSSPELVKKLFKVFHFIYSYAVLFNIHSFTLDEFAQAFHDKDSMLLGQIHLTLLELLLSDVDMELSRGFFPPVSNNGKFVELLHSVENQQNVVEFWKKSLNPLTWTEVLRQVFLAAGFGSKNVTPRKESLSKEVTIMVKYGLSPATLKGELFSILSEQGNNGMKVSDLANSPQIVDLNLAASTEELESLISSALSSDITLFEKISCAAYRLRIHPVMEEAETFDLDSEDFGSVDNDSKDNDIYSSDDDSECGSDRRRLDQGGCQKKGNGALTVYTEIDESHPGEVWLLGLIEGEYSDLSIAEKLNALVALVDLLSAGSSIRMEDRRSPSMESVHTLNHYGSGAKIKRSAGSSNHSWPSSFGGYIGQMLATKDTISGLHPVDSSAFMLKFCGNAKSCSQRKYANETDAEVDLHPMQSIFLGSDRRYNRYWLFLGPCNGLDPGHKRIYFESSEDGHWEVIDTEEALCNLLSALDCRGAREAYLLASLKRREMFLCQSIQSDQSEVNISRDDSSSAVSELDNNICLSEMNNDFSVSSSSKLLKTGNKEEKMQKWSRLQAFDAWIWNSFYSELNAVKYSKRSYLDSLTRCECCHDLYWRDEKHCKTCHTTFELDFDLEERYAIHVATCKADGEADMFPNHKVLSSQLQALKAAIHAIESVMPEGALVGAWIKSAHKLWIKRLRRTSTLAEFLQVLADFVGAINEDWCQSDDDQGFNSVLGEIISSFKTMSQTSSAVAVWLVKMDALIAPFLKRETVTRFRGKHASNL